MLELFDPHPDVNVREAEYHRLLGYPPRHELTGRARELADWARQWWAEHGKPWVYLRETDALELANETFRLHGTPFASPRLGEQLAAARAHAAVLAAVSAGREGEETARQLWREGRPDEYFFLETFGSALVEHLITTAGARLCAWAEQNKMAVLPHYSPGYSGWDISEQPRLWNLIRQPSGAACPGELRVMATGMLQPKKSLLAVFGVTRHRDAVRQLPGLVPCENCSFSPCRFRRAPYQHPRPQIEAAWQYQPRGAERVPDENFGGSGLDHDAKYSLNVRALQKWSAERLRLETLPDGSVAAEFRYEGTTCSNLGRALEYHYQVRLGPATGGHRLVESRCAPAPDDTGHAAQCEYLNDAAAFMRAVAAEKPLLGRPLNDVLGWKRPCDPSGCYCRADRRAHKWGLVLEVIHYALVQREKELKDRQLKTAGA